MTKNTKLASKKTAKKPGRPKKVIEQTFALELTRDEIVHIRNVLSVVLPPTGETRLSESLIEASELDEVVDVNLWQKVWNLCEQVGIEVGDDAPDFLVGPCEPTPLAVFQINLEEEDDS